MGRTWCPPKELRFALFIVAAVPDLMDGSWTGFFSHFRDGMTIPHSSFHVINVNMVEDATYRLVYMNAHICFIDNIALYHFAIDSNDYPQDIALNPH